MKATVTFTDEDFLQYQLYTASKSKTIKRTRFRSWLFTTGCFFLIGIAFYVGDSMFLAYYFWIASVLALMFFPYYHGVRLKKHYKKHIEENYSNRTNIPCDIDLELTHIYMSDKTGESKVNTAELVEVSEVPDHFFLKFSTNVSLILPKQYFTYNDLLQKLSEIAAYNGNVIFNKDLNWKWK